MKPPWEWTEADLLSLIDNQVQESIDLDFKAADALQKTDCKKDEISKDVSAFANSAGGTIVYGVREDKGKRFPVELVGCDPSVITREWLEQVINSTVRRRIDGVRINPVPLDHADTGGVAYVVHIPQSLRAPHQAADKKFYKRFNFHSVPMEEYEIRDVAGRATKPMLELRCVDSRVVLPTNLSGQSSYEMDAQFQVLNNSAATATFVVITLGLGPVGSARFPSVTDWRWIHNTDTWKAARCVIASGSSLSWSPITPGYTLMVPLMTLVGPSHEKDIFSPRPIGFVRMDHDGAEQGTRWNTGGTGRPAAGSS